MNQCWRDTGQTSRVTHRASHPLEGALEHVDPIKGLQTRRQGGLWQSARPGLMLGKAAGGNSSEHPKPWPRSSQRRSGAGRPRAEPSPTSQHQAETVPHPAQGPAPTPGSAHPSKKKKQKKRFKKKRSIRLRVGRGRHPSLAGFFPFLYFFSSAVFPWSASLKNYLHMIPVSVFAWGNPTQETNHS